MNDSSAITTCRHTTLAILAGGEGRRMGGPKSNLIIERQPVLERLLDRLNWPGPTLLVSAPGREHPNGWHRFTNEVTDSVKGEGPLRGILTALEHASTNDIVVVPVDMPNINTAQLAWLVTRLQEHPEATLAVFRCPKEESYRIEPLPAALRVNHGKALVRAQLRDGHLALYQLAASTSTLLARVPSDWPVTFWTNINTPLDLVAYEQSTIE